MRIFFDWFPEYARIKNGDKTIYFAPEMYGNIGLLLDDIFVYYLSGHIDPYTYGKNWILNSNHAFDTLLLAPVEWVLSPNVAITEISHDWAGKFSPKGLGITPRSTLHIRFKESKKDWPFSVYGVATNNYKLAQLLLRNAKAVAMLNGSNFFDVTSKPLPSVKDYENQLVFRNWLRMEQVANKILIDVGRSLDNMKGWLR